MTPAIVDDTPAAATAADRQARANWRANLAALARTQPPLACRLEGMPRDVEWVYGRDGSLTALDATGRWWAGCSVPQRTAEILVRKLKLTGTTGCHLAPAHAAHIHAALAKLAPEQALMVVLPEAGSLEIALGCCDFAGEIARHRLWFAAGEAWTDDLRTILADYPGLPVPQQFVRTGALSEERLAGLIGAAQRVFSQQAQERAAALEALRSRPPRPWRGLRRVCIVAPMRFRLWDDAGAVLAEALRRDRAVEWTMINVDDPAAASQLGLAMTADECDAVVAVNVTRGDLPGLVHAHTPWITWLTRPSLAAFSDCGPRDGLLLADSAWMAAAQVAGWSADRLALAAWPMEPPHEPATPREPTLALIADTADLRGERAFDLSTHRLLWELIREELLENPWALAGDVPGYLAQRMARLSIADEGLDRRLYFDELIAPACAQGLARALLKAGLPLRLHGQGWDEIGEFAESARGPIVSRAELSQAAQRSMGLVHPWPAEQAHPIDALGQPVLRAGCNPRNFIERARRILAGDVPAAGPPADALAASTLRSLLEP